MRLHPGEIEADGWRIMTVVAVLKQLSGTTPDVSGRPRVIAVDGRGGAGKTTLVERLRQAVPNSGVVHTDDIAWYHACFDWAPLLIENVLQPLQRGEAVDFRPPAWISRDRPGSIVVPAGLDVVWVEGTGVIRQELAGWFDASVWMQGDLDEQERRLVARDGDGPEQLEQVASWMLEELPFMLRERPWSRATLIVAGPAHLDHDEQTELVVAEPVSDRTAT